MGRRERTMGIVVLSVLVTVIVVIALVAVLEFGGSPPAPGPVGLAFGAVRMMANLTIATTPGGPWVLTSALGILSDEPVWFNAIGDEICRGLPGVSAWNASRIPLAADQFNSGLVPFWSLIYENQSRYLVDAVALNEALHLVGPIAPTSACGALLAQVVGNFTTVSGLDSPAASSYAWSLAGSSFLKAHPSAYEFYEIGAGQLPNWGSVQGGWIIGYQLCGLPGYGGLAPEYASAAAFRNTTGSYLLTNLTGGCTESGYNVTYGTATNSSGPESSIVSSIPLSLGFDNSTNKTDGWGLTTGSTAVSIDNLTSGTSLLPASLSCGVANLSLASCGGVEQDWYAVLESPTGYWLDAYSDAGGVPGWMLPNVPFYSGDLFLYIHGSTSGDESVRISIVSTSDSFQVSGSTTI